MRFDFADPFDLHAPQADAGSRRARRFGTTLFWAAVTALIAARVVLFDPAAVRPVGEWVSLPAAPATSR